MRYYLEKNVKITGFENGNSKVLELQRSSGSAFGDKGSGKYMYSNEVR